jgi:hypothetical protein
MKLKSKPNLAIIIFCSLVLGFTACNQNNDTDDLNADDLQDLGTTVISETESSASSTSISDAITGVGGLSAPVAEIQTHIVQTRALPADCPTIVAGSKTDTDGDGVPDSITYQFDAIKCEQAVPAKRGGGTQTISGQLQIIDTSPSPDRSYRETLLSLKYVRDPLLKPKFTETRNGTREVTQSGNTALTKTYDLGLVRQVALRPKVTLHNKMTFAFQVSGTGVIDLNQPLPAGTFVLSGSNEFTVGTKLPRVFTTSTPTPLVYDPTCESQRIVGGELRLAKPNAEVKIVFGACGVDPVISRIL